MSAGEVLRTVIVFAIMATVFGWSMSIRAHTPIWLRAGDLRALLVSLGVLPVLVVNGIGIIYAATKGLPVTWLTFAYAGSYVVLNICMWIPLPTRPTYGRRSTDGIAG